MDKRILKFYERRGLQAHKLIEKGALRNLSRARIEAAMEYCYKRIVDEGKEIDILDIARYVFNVAKDVDAEIYEKDNDLLNLAKQELHRDKRIFYYLLGFIIFENWAYAIYQLIRMFYG